MSDSRTDADTKREEGVQEIDRRFRDENAEGRQEIIDTATRASESDRLEPDSPERRERAHGVEDPSHSKGSTRRKS